LLKCVKAVSKVGKFSDIECSIISCLVMGIFMPKNSIVTKFCHLALGVQSGNYASPCILQCSLILLFVWWIVQLEQRREPVGGSSAVDSTAEDKLADKSNAVPADR